MVEPLRVDPTQLNRAASQIDEHARAFKSGHEAAEVLAEGARLGSGAAGAALAGMLAAWRGMGARFAAQHAVLADKHRQAASAYTTTDGGAAAQIGDAAAGL
ncbi:hypothetical protein MFM001_35800 [Mycobacterium sp. MFM001]|uniref:type VII secretion target n=1 Tax=Mycobacterium sp. MFM001 TaxID=2049453 RepID=UPI000DA49937|nr:type VII secretion target [Mycobacterium sp. MFM001]GBE67118.1 hypothetical protein MFM001_35800 [Mycobacterium sp. MFM001]